MLEERELIGIGVDELAPGPQAVAETISPLRVRRARGNLGCGDTLILEDCILKKEEQPALKDDEDWRELYALD